MATTRKLMTADELWRLPDDGQRHELIAGELRTMSPTGDEHGTIVANLTGSLQPYVRAHRLGKITAGEPGFLLATNPDTVRAPDVAFIRRRAGGKVTGYRPGAPDLAIEVISPHDLQTEIEQKAFMWLAHGTQMVLVVDPRQQTVAVYRSPTEVQRLTAADRLDGGDIVPGWTMPVAEIFADDTAE
jgi:Uma2 family endonuclease